MATWLLAALSALSVLAQRGGLRHVEGRLVDAESRETLPFSNVFVSGTLVGTLTDELGHFALNIPAKYDTLSFSAIGYHTRRELIGALLLRDSVVIDMWSDALAIDEIMVRPDDKPRQLMKAVLANKRRNNPATHPRAQFEKYTRWQYSLANISDRAQANFLLKGAANLMQQQDGDTAKNLPVYFSEVLSQNETQQDPRKLRSTILADRTTGINFFKEHEIGGFSSSLDTDVNFYDDQVHMFGAVFVSPLADECLRCYDYFITDSVALPPPPGKVDSLKVYTLKFRPRHMGDKAFVGSLDVETSRFAVTRVKADMTRNTDINFVKRLSLQSTYQLVADTVPFFASDAMQALVDYMPVNSDKKRLSIAVEMFNSLDHVRLDSLSELELSKKALAIETLKADDYKNRDEAYWEAHRHEPMSERDKLTTSRIDSINNVRTVRLINRAAQTAVTGFLDIGAVEIGPIGEMLNVNKIEGLHLGFGLRTSKEVSEHWTLQGIIGYGFRSTRLTYGAGLAHRFRGAMRSVVDAYYSDGIMRIGENENILYLYENQSSTSETNIVAQLFKRGPIDELYYCRKARLRYDQEWWTGFSTRLQLIAQWLESPKFYPFTQGGDTLRRIENQEVSLDFRLSWREKFMDEGMTRMYMSTKLPIVHITVAGGHVRAAQQQDYYLRLHSTAKHAFYIGRTKLNIALEGGAYFGRLPYPLLNLPRGNKTFGLYRYDYNMMNYLEFVCDRYFGLYADWFLQGLLLHKVNWMSKAGLREVVSLKGLVGGLRSGHAKMLDLPEGVGAPSKPYFEVGLGLDNILRFLRVDCVWRPLSKPLDGSSKVGVRFQLSLKL